MSHYTLVQNSYIQLHQQAFVDQCVAIQRLLNTIDPAESYRTYNAFSITAGCPHFHMLFQQLAGLLRQQWPQGPLWLGAWVNIHLQHQVLDWHDHFYPYHGFICIDAKHTVTQFDAYDIINQTGQIYLGPGDRRHRVVVTQPFAGPRITIGFDVTAEPTVHAMQLKDQYIDATGCLGLIPIPTGDFAAIAT